MSLELNSEEVLRNMRLAVHGLDWSVRTRKCLANERSNMSGSLSGTVLRTGTAVILLTLLS